MCRNRKQSKENEEDEAIREFEDYLLIDELIEEDEEELDDDDDDDDF